MLEQTPIPINEQQIKQAIQAFLTAQYDKKTEKEQKLLAKAIEDNDVAKIAELNDLLQPFKDKYYPDTWLTEAKKMAENVQVGTHVSKGVHPSSRGDNVNFTDSVSHDFVNTKTITSRLLDANSPRGAIDLPLVSFFEWEAVAGSGIKMRDVILQNSPAVMASFAENLSVSQAYQQAFLTCLNNQLTQPKTHESNKQILWAIEGDYRTLVPLYPTVLAHEVFQHINAKRYSDDNKTARDNRHKKTVEQKPYVTIKDLATLQLGGTKPQNVSQLMSKQGGRNYLLPSLPPKFTQSQDIRISDNDETMFDNKALQFRAKKNLNLLFKLMKTQYNNANIRNTCESLVHDIAYQVLQNAHYIQQNRPAGWSKNSHLSPSQRYWLDPQRANLEGEEEFKQQREQTDWRKEIETQFADWLQTIFKKEFQHIAHDFTDTEHDAWRKIMKEVINNSLRLGEGVFA